MSQIPCSRCVKEITFIFKTRKITSTFNVLSRCCEILNFNMKPFSKIYIIIKLYPLEATPLQAAFSLWLILYSLKSLLHLELTTVCRYVLAYLCSQCLWFLTHISIKPPMDYFALYYSLLYNLLKIKLMRISKFMIGRNWER